MILEVPFEKIIPFTSAAAREKVSLKPTAGRTIWYETAGHESFGGLLNFAAGAWRIRGVFTQPEFRGLGYGTKLTEGLIETAKTTLEARTIEVIAMNPKFYEDRGFTRITEIRHGSWRLALRITGAVGV